MAMVTRPLFFLALLIIWQPVRADDHQDKLRALVRVPDQNMSFNFTYSHNDGYNYMTGSNAGDGKEEAISALSRRHLPDPDRYYALGNIYANYQETDAAKQAWEQSIKLFQVQSKRVPNDGSLLAALALALHQAKHEKERDQVIAAAVKNAPTNWKVWSALADIEIADALTAMSGEMENIQATVAPTRLFTILKQKPSEAQMRKAFNLMKQAKEHYEKMVTVSPGRSAPYSEHFVFYSAFRCYTALLQQMLNGKSLSEETLQQAGNNYALSLLLPEVLSDMVTAARLSRDDPFVIGMAAFFVMSAELAKKPERFDIRQGGALHLLTGRDQKTAGDLLERLLEMSHSKDRILAGRSAMTLGVLQILAQTSKVAEVTLQRAFRLIPDDPRSVDSLIAVYVNQSRWGELETFLTEVLKSHESVRWRLILAKAREKQEHWAEAEQEVLAILKQAPANFDANLVLCALWLREAKDGPALVKTGEQMVRTYKLYPQAPTSEQRASYVYLRGIYFGLTGNAEEAQKSLQDLIGNEEYEENVRQALALLPAK